MTKSKRSPLFEWRTALQQSRQPFIVKSTLLLMADYADNTSLLCWPGQAELCEKSGLHRSTINKRLKMAVESGWMAEERRGKKGKDGRGWNTRYLLKIGPADPTDVNVDPTGQCRDDCDVNVASEGKDENVNVASVPVNVAFARGHCRVDATRTTVGSAVGTTLLSDPPSAGKEPAFGRAKIEEEKVIDPSSPKPLVSNSISIFPSRAAWPGSRAAMHAGHRAGYSDDKLIAAYLAFTDAHPTLTYMAAERMFIDNLSRWVEAGAAAVVASAEPEPEPEPEPERAVETPASEGEWSVTERDRNYARALRVDADDIARRMVEWTQGKRVGPSSQLFRQFAEKETKVPERGDALVDKFLCLRPLYQVARELGVPWDPNEINVPEGLSGPEEREWRTAKRAAFKAEHGDAVAELCGVR